MNNIDMALQTLGVDVSALPDNLKTTRMKALCEALGVDTSDMADTLMSSFCKQIINKYDGGDGSGISGKAIVERTITEIDNESITTLGAYAVYNCSNLIRVNLPNVESINANGLASNPNLIEVNLPSLKTVGRNGMASDTALKKLDFDSLEEIGTNGFAQCSNLSILIIRSNSLCTLSTTSAFSYTPFAANGAGGTVYAPTDLIEAYENDTNWSTLNCNFVAIEGSEYE